MTISAEEKYLLNNKMGRVAHKVQLGTLIENAETISAGEVALEEGKVFIGNASDVAAATTLTSGQIVVGNGSSVAAAVSVTGDVTLSSSGVTAIAAGVVVNADVSASAAIAFSKMEALTSARLIVGSAGNVPTAVDVTGDVTIDNAGVTAIAAGAIVNADVNASAAIAFSKMEALASARLVVGSAGNVATGVDVTGDVTIGNTGVTAIGASKVLTSMIADANVTAVKISGSNGATKVQRFSVGFAALNAATTGVAALFGTAIPDNSIITRVFIDVTATFVDNGTAGDADSSTIKIGIEDQDNDVVAAIAISDGGNPWDAGLHEGIQVGTAATMVKLSAARQLAVTWTDGTGDSTALTAGAMEVFVEYVEST